MNNIENVAILKCLLHYFIANIAVFDIKGGNNEVLRLDNSSIAIYYVMFKIISYNVCHKLYFVVKETMQVYLNILKLVFMCVKYMQL